MIAVASPRTTTAQITETKMIHHLLQPLLLTVKSPLKEPFDEDTLDTDTVLQLLPLTCVAMVTSEVDELHIEVLEKESNC